MMVNKWVELQKNKDFVNHNGCEYTT